VFSSNVLADPTVTSEEVQTFLIRLLREIGFTEKQIEENRSYNGCLFLTSDAMIGAMGGFELGTQLNTETGELILSNEAQALVDLKDMLDGIIDQATAKFEDLNDPVPALVSFCRYGIGRLEELEQEIDRKPGNAGVLEGGKQNQVR
jgi:hypothetical protein